MSGVEKSDLSKIYLLPIKATREIKLTMFQYKIIHRILPTNSLLHKMKKVASPSCPFCPSEHQTLWHLLINCEQASSFWNRFQEWYSTSSNTKLLLSELEVMFGIIRCHTYCLALNHHDNSFATGGVLIKTENPSFCLKRRTIYPTQSIDGS